MVSYACEQLFLAMRALAIILLIAGDLCCGVVAAGADIYAYGTLAGYPGGTGITDGTNYAARFNNPYGVAVDSAGNIYVADTYSCTIRKVSPSGTNWVTTTIAGLANGASWADGTNGAARFNLPYSVASDRAGNLYVADYGNHVIRKVTPVGTNWVASTLAGSSSIGGTADGTNGNARFGSPYDVKVDRAGTLYVTDAFNNTIRKVAPSGTNWVVTTLAGSVSGDCGSTDGTNRTATFCAPGGLAVDGATNLYVADAGNNTIRKIRPVGTNWVVTTLAGLALNSGSADGTNSSARFNAAAGVTVDNATNLYVADTGNSTIRKIVPVGTNWVTSTIGGVVGTYAFKDGTNSSAWFSFPAGVVVDSAGLLYLADRGNSVVRLGVPSLTNAPTLRFAHSTSQLVLSWPLTAYSFLLETRGAVSAGTWSPVSGSVVAAGTWFYWTNTLGAVPAYYRLQKQ